MLIGFSARVQAVRTVLFCSVLCVPGGIKVKITGETGIYLNYSNSYVLPI